MVRRRAGGGRICFSLVARAWTGELDQVVKRWAWIGLVAAVMAASSVMGIAPAGAVGSGGISAWALQNENPNSNYTPVSQTQAVQDAMHFNFITAHSIAYGCSVPPPPGGCPASRVPAMRQANPKLTLLLYMNATFAQQDQGPGTANGFDPSWYAKDSKGNYIRNPSSGNYLMDPTNSAWIQHDADWCKQQLTGYDGCYLDALGLAPLLPGYLSAQPVDASTGKTWTKTDWLKATAQLAAKVRSMVHPLKLFGNGLTNGTFFYQRGAPTKQIVDGIDGGIAEEWLRLSTSSASSFPSTAVWKQNVDMIKVIEGEGKPCLVVTKLWSSASTALQNAWLQYALASFLLGTQGRSAFFFSPSSHSSRTQSFSIYSTNLGTPSGSYALTAGVYQRSFSNGLVMVNPSGGSVTVKLAHSYYTTSRQKVTSVTLTPNSGVLLTDN
jgi:hypothetical protein